MTKILIITHGFLANELINSAKMLIGKLENVFSICFTNEMGIEELNDKIIKFLNENQNQKIIVLTDILGGSPFNKVSELTYKNENIKVIYGINLPCFIEIYMSKDMNFDELTEYINNFKNETIGISDL